MATPTKTQTIPKKKKMHKLTSPTMKTKLTRDSNHWSLISLKINGLNSPIKRHRVTDWIRKQIPSFSCIQETHFNLKDRHHLRIKGWEKNFQSNEPKKQAGVAILLSNKIDFKVKSIKRRTFHISHKKIHLNTKHLCPKYKSTLICKRNTTKA